MKTQFPIVACLLTLMILFSACGTSPWDGTEANSPALVYAQQGCDCMNSFLGENGVDVNLLVKEAENFEADRTKVNTRLMTEEEMRAKHGKLFEIAESLPTVMQGFGEYPCNVELKTAVTADSLNLEFSEGLREHCVLTTYFKR